MPPASQISTKKSIGLERGTSDDSMVADVDESNSNIATTRQRWNYSITVFSAIR